MEAKTLNEIKEIKDITKAVKAYAQAKKLGVEMVNDATEIELRAYREMGKLIQQTEPIRLNEGTTITNCILFIESHFATVKAGNGNTTFLPYLNRLKEFKQLLMKELN